METTVIWEEYRDEVWICRNGVKNDKVKLELNLTMKRIT